MLVKRNLFFFIALIAAVFIGSFLYAGNSYGFLSQLAFGVPHSIQHFFIYASMVIGALVYVVIIVAMFRLQWVKRIRGEVVEISVMADFIWTTIPFVMISMMIFSVLSL